MAISSIAPNRQAAYIPSPSGTAAGRKPPVSPAPQDALEISREARAAAARQPEASAPAAVEAEPSSGSAAAAFTSFSAEFHKITQGYSATVRDHYAAEHAENLHYPDPKHHVWDKYKNPESPDFRGDMPEDERAWSYDHELDLLNNGGKHMQLTNPYAFPDGAPTLSEAASRAVGACWEQIDQSVHDMLEQMAIPLPEGASFQLTVDEDRQIHVEGLEDEGLAASIEEALNMGDNGKNLYGLLRAAPPAGEAVPYRDGHLQWPEAPADISLEEVKRQTCPDYAQYSAAYDPHKGPMGVISTGGHLDSQESVDRLAAAFRMGVQEMLARDRAGEFGEMKLTPDGPVMTGVYLQTCCEQELGSVKRTVEAYYAAANRENSSYPPDEAVRHIEEKYKLPESLGFRYDLAPAQRDMYYRQEMALLAGGPLMLLDPYAVAPYSVDQVRGMLDILGMDSYGMPIPV